VLSPEEISQKRQRLVRQHIAESGISIQFISGSPSFIYTVGMTIIGAPELICFGLSPESVVDAFNTFYEQIRLGTRKKDFSREDDIWALPFYVDPVETSKMDEFATATFEYFEGSGMTPTFKQLVWPDPRGFYPFEAQFDEARRARQPYFGTRKRRDADHDMSHGLN
jgi:hypothetical protein